MIAAVDTGSAASLEDFFAALFPNLDNAYVELRALPSRAQALFTRPSLVEDMAAQFLVPHAAEDVYFGVATRVEKSGTVAGGADHCGNFGALFCDFDFKSLAEDAVRKQLAEAKVAPSIIVHSGGGLHVYWLLQEPVAAADGAKWLRRMAATLGADLAATDAARILRVPLTLNHKYDPPRPVRIELFGPSRRYTLTDFEWLTADPGHGNGSDAGHVRRSASEWAAALRGVPEGQRQAELVKVVGKLIAEVQDRDFARTLAHEWAERCEPPVAAGDVDSCFDRIAAKEDAKPRTETNRGGSAARFVPLKGMAMTAVPWLWPGYLAQGAVHLLVGDPDKGKTLAALDIAARVSTGAAWPDGLPNTHGPSSVLVLSAEDSPAYTLRPRLEAAGGDSGRVYVLAAESVAAAPSVAGNLDRLEAALAETGATLVVIDPLSAYMPGIDTYRDNEVRAALAPFVALAERRGVTVLAIVHMSKNVERSAMQRVLGSTAFTALSRATFMVSQDPDDNDRRVFLPVKFNLGKRPAGLAFKPTGVSLANPGGAAINTVRAAWEATPVDLHPDEVLRRLTTAGASKYVSDDTVRALFVDGPVLAKDAEAKLGVSEATLRRARQRLGIESMRDPADPGAGAYYWLPPRWPADDREQWLRSRMSLRTWKASDQTPAA